MKFCKDCRYQTGKNLYGGLLCSRKHAKFTEKDRDKVTKEFPTQWYLQCENERDKAHKNFCGPEAKYFEPRKTFIERLKEWFK